jgi:hypothetical protein
MSRAFMSRVVITLYLLHHRHGKYKLVLISNVPLLLLAS